MSALIYLFVLCGWWLQHAHMSNGTCYRAHKRAIVCTWLDSMKDDYCYIEELVESVQIHGELFMETVQTFFNVVDHG